MAFVWLAWPNQAKASCGYYVIIGRPSAQTAAEQARMRQEQMPVEHRECPCNGPQCKQQNRPMTPVQGGTVSVKEPMAMNIAHSGSAENDFGGTLIEEFAFLSDPHIWRIDPPPRF